MGGSARRFRLAGRDRPAARERRGPHRDVATLHGPLSPVFQALLFRAFGATLWTIWGANLVLLVALSALLFRLLDGLFGRAAATAALLFFLLVFAFGHYASAGNYKVFGEEKILEAFERTPPGWILITPRDTAEFGASSLADYAPHLADWIAMHYAEAASPAGFTLLKRRA